MEIPVRIAEEINKKIRSGLYQSPEDVLQRALEALTLYDQVESDIQTNINIGRRQLDRGEGIPGEVIFSEIREMNKLLRA